VLALWFSFRIERAAPFANLFVHGTCGGVLNNRSLSYSLPDKIAFAQDPKRIRRTSNTLPPTVQNMRVYHRRFNVLYPAIRF